MPRPRGAYHSRNQAFKQCMYGSFRDGDRMRCLRNPRHNVRVVRQMPVVAPRPPPRRSARLARLRGG